MERGFQQAAAVLPPELAQSAAALPKEEQERAEELRLRVGQPLAAVLPEGERRLGERKVTPRDVELLLEMASRASVHAVLEQLREGFVTVEGGHRVGFCGTVVMERGEITFLRGLTSASVRIARECRGIGEELAADLFDQGRLQSTLILAPPGGGKTSLLRDLIRTLSSGLGVPPQRVGVVDSRGELGAVWQGMPQLDLGERTDILTACPKDKGLLMLLRAMNPQVLAADEVTAPEDVQALLTAAGCGVSLLTTVHGGEAKDLSRRKLYREMLEAGVFRRLVTIQGRGFARSYTVEVLK